MWSRRLPMLANSLDVDVVFPGLLHFDRSQPAERRLGSRARDQQIVVSGMRLEWYAERAKNASLGARAIALGQVDELVGRQRQHHLIRCVRIPVTPGGSFT